MKRWLCSAICALLMGFAAASVSFGVDAALMKAKKDAEAKGYTFVAGHEEILAKAKREGKLRVLAGMEPPTIKATAAAFVPFTHARRAYPQVAFPPEIENPWVPSLKTPD